MKSSDNLKQQIKVKFEQIELDGQQLDSLNALQSMSHGHKQVRPRKYNSVFLKLAVAASLFIAMTIFTMNYFNSVAILPEVANEIAQNHIRLDKVEYQSNHFVDIAGYFDQLDFVPRLPDDLPDFEQDNLLGARYCSVQGNIALQLRYGHNLENSQALYIASPKAKIKTQIEKQLSQHNNRYLTTIGDIEIELWLNQDLLFAVSRWH